MVLHIQEMAVVGFGGSLEVVGCGEPWAVVDCGELPVLVEEILHMELMVAVVESCSVLEMEAENGNGLLVVAESCNEPAVAEVESCNRLVEVAESCSRLAVEAESYNERLVEEEEVNTLYTVEVVVVLYKEVGEEGNRPEWVVEKKLVLVGAVETDMDKSVGEVNVVVEVNAAAVKNAVVVVSCSSKVQVVEEKIVVVAASEVVGVVDGCNKLELVLEKAEEVEKSILAEAEESIPAEEVEAVVVVGESRLAEAVEAAMVVAENILAEEAVGAVVVEENIPEEVVAVEEGENKQAEAVTEVVGK